jgi:7,8-dihydropterin-6-yl-methyl-4-(beta-D-ribofuranosyl)aminobenzene 5'-phosphate synthase
MADVLTVTCLVDNTALMGSDCWAEHGEAFLVETDNAKVLFDTGSSGDVLAHNLAVLDKDLENLSTIVLSHGHYDHVGGLERAILLSGYVDVVAHPAVFAERIARDDGKEDRPVGIPRNRTWVETRTKLRLTEDPVEVAPGIHTTGQVPRGAGPEPRDARLLSREVSQLVPDRIVDDQSLVLITSAGLVVIMGCCHAGLINTLEHVSRTFEGGVFAVLGGTHLAHADETTLRESVAAAKDRHAVVNTYVGHCTGTRGLLAFAEVFGECARPCPAGLSLTF